MFNCNWPIHRLLQRLLHQGQDDEKKLDDSDETKPLTTEIKFYVYI